ncbi:unnamed protein product [Boreogadus saida]
MSVNDNCRLHLNRKPCILVSVREFVLPPPLLFRKLSNPDLSPAAAAVTKSQLHRQLSQDENRARRGSMAMTGKQLLPLSSSLHGGVSQLWQAPAAPPGPGEGNNLVWMRNQTLGQSAPSLTGLALWESLKEAPHYTSTDALCDCVRTRFFSRLSLTPSSWIHHGIIMRLQKDEGLFCTSLLALHSCPSLSSALALSPPPDAMALMFNRETRCACARTYSILLLCGCPAVGSAGEDQCPGWEQHVAGSAVAPRAWLTCPWPLSEPREGGGRCGLKNRETHSCRRNTSSGSPTTLKVMLER